MATHNRHLMKLNCYPRIYQFKKQNYLSQTCMTLDRFPEICSEPPFSSIFRFNMLIFHVVIGSFPPTEAPRLSEMTGSKEEKQDYQVLAEELLMKVPRQGMSWKTHRKNGKIMESIWFEGAVSVLTCYRSVFLAVTYLKCNQWNVFSECDLLVLMGVHEGGAT